MIYLSLLLWSERFSLRRTAQLQPTAALDWANRRAELLVAPKLAMQTLQVLYRNEITIISIKDGSGAVTITPPSPTLAVKSLVYVCVLLSTQ